MEPLVFDIEARGLLPDLAGTGSQGFLCATTVALHSGRISTYSPAGLQALIANLKAAPYLIAHNGLSYDLPALSLLGTEDLRYLPCRDTLVLSRLLYLDRESLPRWTRVPPALRQSHSLKAWGYRLKLHKLDTFEGSDWATVNYSQSLQDYCTHDTLLTRVLYQYLQDVIEDSDTPATAIDLEHHFTRLMALQTTHGFCFDTERAVNLATALQQKQATLLAKLKTLQKGWYRQAGPDKVKEPRKTINYRNRPGITAGAPYSPLVWVPFNPSSRQQVIRYFRERGWNTKKALRTENDNVRMDEEVLSDLPYREAPWFSQLFLLQKRLSQLATGTQAWLKLAVNGRIHGNINSCGTITARCSHSKPNMAQVPSVNAPHGKACRALFTVPPGWVLLGADASGLELRCLAHYLYPHDGGAYRDILLEGDVHTANQEMADLPDRNTAKTFIYAFLYGAGNELIGKLVNGGEVEGKATKARFLDSFQELKALLKDLETTVDKTRTRRKKGYRKKQKQGGYLLTIDDRRIPVRYDHAILNTLLQSTGAIICKQWTVQIEEAIRATGLQQGWDRDYCFCANIHDEVQIACRTPDIARQIGHITSEAIRTVEHLYLFKCPLDAQWKIGRNWSETH